jgi:hypothetical protein
MMIPIPFSASMNANRPMFAHSTRLACMDVYLITRVSHTDDPVTGFLTSNIENPCPLEV